MDVDEIIRTEVSKLINEYFEQKEAKAKERREKARKARLDREESRRAADAAFESSLRQKTELVEEWLSKNEFPERETPVDYFVPKSLIHTTSESEDEHQAKNNRPYRKRYRKTLVLAKSPKKCKIRKTRKELDNIRKRALRTIGQNLFKYYRK